jgi:hypothetical protein
VLDFVLKPAAQELQRLLDVTSGMKDPNPETKVKGHHTRTLPLGSLASRVKMDPFRDARVVLRKLLCR